MNESSQKIGQRNWWQLHASTWFCMFLLTIPYLLILIPGNITWWSIERAAGTNLTPQNPGLAVAGFEHGWPCVHLKRVSVEPIPGESMPAAEFIPTPEQLNAFHESAEPSWLDRSFATIKIDRHFGVEDHDIPLSPGWMSIRNWNHTGFRTSVDWLGLVINLVLFVVVIGTFTMLLEWRRRRTTTFFQFSITNILITTFVFAFVFNFFYQANQTKSRTDHIVNELSPYANFENDWVAPAICIKLVGRENCRTYYRPVRLFFGSNQAELLTSETLSIMATKLNQCRHLKTIKTTQPNQKFFDFCSQCRYLQRIELASSVLKNNQWDTIRFSPGLTELEIFSLTNRSNTPPGNQFLESIARSNIRSLNVSFMSLVDCDWITLKESSIRKIFLRSTNTSPEQLEDLKGLKLEILEVDGNRY